MCRLDFPKTQAKGAVVVVHGFKGSAAQVHISAIAQSICDAGFITLRPDLTCDPGESYLPFSEMTYARELSDLGDITQNFSNMDKVKGLPIGICGHSLGGMLAAEIAANREEVKALVTLSAVFDWKFVIENIFMKPYKEAMRDFNEKGWSYVWSKSLERRLKVGRAFYEDIAGRTADNFAQKIKCPTLVVSSGKDESVVQDHAEKYLKNIGSMVKKMVIIEGSDHNYSQGKWLDTVCGLTAGWFAGHLQ